jgi:hypothetical protein
MISYDPDKAPSASPELIDAAKRMGMKIVQVICDEPGAQVGADTGVSFFAAVDFIPRIGDKIDLEDGRSCEVKSVHFKVVTMRGSGGKAEFINLFPNVYAMRWHK